MLLATPPERGPEQTTGVSNGRNRSPSAQVGAPTSPPQVQDSGLETRACPGEAPCLTYPLSDLTEDSSSPSSERW